MLLVPANDADGESHRERNEAAVAADGGVDDGSVLPSTMRLCADSCDSKASVELVAGPGVLSVHQPLGIHCYTRGKDREVAAVVDDKSC